MQKERKFDFAGWVTKNDIKCKDGVIIRHNAFIADDKKQVPLIWEHKHGDPKLVLGHIILHSKTEGVYGYGFLNASSNGQHAKELIDNGDISSMSIWASNIEHSGVDITRGEIQEVSLVITGANPGAQIETIAHTDSSEEVLIHTGLLIHSEGDVIAPEDEDPVVAQDDKTLGDIIDSMTDEQRDAMAYIILQEVEAATDGTEPKKPILNKIDTIQQSAIMEEPIMKKNVFDGANTSEEGIVGTTLSHSDIQGIIVGAIDQKSTLKQVILAHSITNLEVLFPDAVSATKEPIIIQAQNTATERILAAVNKSPFSKVKSITADITPGEARAKGYIKGTEKFEQIFGLLSRDVSPTTVYVKQKLDRDDIIDIEANFDIISFMQKIMRVKHREEVAKAIMVGDGRLVTDPYKIKEDKIIPILKDDLLYCYAATTPSTYAGVIPAVVKGLGDWQGTGEATMYADPGLVAELLLLTDNTGRYLFNSLTELATRMGLAEIVKCSFMAEDSYLCVNLADYTIGATKGGELSSFDQFDIDFNQFKYLQESRLSGMLTVPKSAMRGSVNIAAS